MNDYEKTIKDLQDRVKSLELLLQPKGCATKPKQWSPVGGEYYVCNGNAIRAPSSMNAPREFGMERSIKEQAERAAVEMRKFNRLLALRDELCKGDAELGIYHIIFQNRDGTYFIGYSEQQNNEIGSVRFTTREHAKRACDMLNSGEVEL
jgi:hypothetical protein